jgi:hypothetical protein
MSTTFGLFKIPIVTDEDGFITSSYSEEDYIEIAFQANDGGTYWNYPYEIVAEHLDDSVPLYPLNNTPQGIYNIGDIRKKMRTAE